MCMGHTYTTVFSGSGSKGKYGVQAAHWPLDLFEEDALCARCQSTLS